MSVPSSAFYRHACKKEKDYTTGLLNCTLSLNVNATGECFFLHVGTGASNRGTFCRTLSIEDLSIVASSFESFDEFAEFARRQGEKDGATCLMGVLC